MESDLRLFQQEKDYMREQILVGLYPTRSVADEVRTGLEAEAVDPEIAGAPHKR